MYSLGNFTLIFIGCWVIWLGVWLVFWNWSKRTQQKEKSSTSLLYGIFLTLGFVLTISNTDASPILSRQVIPHNTIIVALGAVILILGTLVTLWARYILGDNWSAGVVLKEKHKLIQNGPYAYVRHPIYTGLFFMFLGTVIAVGTLAPILGLIAATISFVIKLRQEEKILTNNFPGEYPAYKARTKALIPLIF